MLVDGEHKVTVMGQWTKHHLKRVGRKVKAIHPHQMCALVGL